MISTVTKIEIGRLLGIIQL